jgi:hypothetical protein
MPGTDVPKDDPYFAVTVDANARAMAYARWFNIKEFKSELTFVGKLVWPNGKGVESGTTLQFVNAGIPFDGKWIIRTVRHEIIDSRFQTMVILYKCLNPEDYKAR